MSRDRSPATARIPWRIVQAVGLAATAALLAGLFLRPSIALTILWKIVIPLVPASLLVSPLLWRNACPLATLNLAAGRGKGRAPGPGWSSATAGAGIGLLGVLVPARHFVFNADGPALAVTVAAIAAVAVALGAVFEAKGGFCNAFCPILPVERLYGQSPLLDLERSHCATCSLCSRSCVDLSPRKAPFRALGSAARWTTTPFGAFAAGFPGFVLGYFTTVDGPLGSAPWTYARVAGWAALSWALATVVIERRGIRARRALPALAAAAVGLYYWFAAPDFGRALGSGDVVAGGLRLAAVGLVAAWWWRADRRARANPAR